MDEDDFLAERFELHRARLRAVAYRMLGSVSEADDAVQDAWLRVSRAGADAFFAAARRGDFDALVAMLDPDVVLRSDRGALPGSAVVRGAEAVAAQALMFSGPSRVARPVLVNGAAGVVVFVDGRPVSIM